MNYYISVDRLLAAAPLLVAGYDTSRARNVNIV